jgi:hypothetical protein
MWRLKTRVSQQDEVIKELKRALDHNMETERTKWQQDLAEMVKQQVQDILKGLDSG